MGRDAFTNGGADSRSAFQAINKTATAAGAGDNTLVNGAWVSRKSANGIALSAKLIILYTATLAQGATLSFAAQMQDATTVGGAGSANVLDAVALAVAATGGTGGSTEVGTVEIDMDLSLAREFIRANITPDLSAGGTDTCEWAAVLVFYGEHRNPSTKSAVSLGGATAI